MRNILNTIVLLLIFGSVSFAQDVYSIREAMDFYRTNKLTSGDYSTMLTESDINGSPYLNDDFINGTIYTIKKEKYVDIPLRYNLYNDQIEFKTPEDKVQAIGDPNVIDFVEFGDNKIEYLTYILTKKSRKGYLSLIEKGKASLYIKGSVMFKKAEEPGAYKEAAPAQFVRRPNIYFIRIGNSAAQKVGSKKEILEIFPDKQKELTAFMKKNKVKPSKEESLVQLVQYYNSL